MLAGLVVWSWIHFIQEEASMDLVWALDQLQGNSQGDNTANHLFLSLSFSFSELVLEHGSTVEPCYEK